MAVVAAGCLKVVDGVAMINTSFRCKPPFGEAKNDQGHFHSPQ